MSDQPIPASASENRISPDAPPPDEIRVTPGETPYKRIYVIVNPAAGQDKPILGLFNNAFTAAGIDWELMLTKKAGDGFRFAREAIAAGVDAVAVYGGDGTVMEVANGLVGSSVPLAIFPGGTANVMSVELGIPSDLAQATALVSGSESVVRAIDMGYVDERHFMLRLGIGFEAEMTLNNLRETKERAGRLSYMLTALQLIPNRTIARYRLILDGQEVEAEGVTCMVGNSGSLGLPGLQLSKHISVDDGLLDVIVIRDADIASLLELASHAMGRTEPLMHWQAREVTVIADPPQPVVCDGEPLDPTPLTARIVPQAIRMIVPKQATPASGETPATK